MRQFSEAVFVEIQTARNTRRWHHDNPSYDYRGRPETVAQMFDLGYTVPEFAASFGASDQTIQRDLSKSRNSQQQPPHGPTAIPPTPRDE